MPHLRDRAAIEDILEKTVTMGSHRNQIALIFLRGFQNPKRRLTKREVRFHLNPAISQSLGDPIEICSIGLHLFRFRQLKPMIIARRPAIRNVQQKKLRSMNRGQLGDGREHRRIGWTVIERDEDFLEHWLGEVRVVLSVNP